MIKNKTLKEVHNYFIEILGFDEKSSDAAHQQVHLFHLEDRKFRQETVHIDV
jgi:hypothetical protein